MIIDGGGSNNAVSTNMVEKLGLPTTEHLQPYKQEWLNDHNDLTSVGFISHWEV